MESQILIQQNITVDLSEQNLIDCDLNESGCSGGDPYAAMNWIKTNPITYEFNYPYKARNMVCKRSSAWETVRILDQTADYELNGDENALLNLVKYNGPTVVAIYASDYLQSYSSGIFVDPTCTFNQDPNHAVLVSYTQFT